MKYDKDETKFSRLSMETLELLPFDRIQKIDMNLNLSSFKTIHLLVPLARSYINEIQATKKDIHMGCSTRHHALIVRIPV